MKHFKTLRITVTTAIALCLAQAWADTPRALSMDEATQLAFEGNPELRMAEFALERARQQLKWAGRLSNPELEIGLRDDAFGEDEGEGSFELGISQSFPLTSRLRKEKALRQSAIILAEAEIQQHRRQLAADVEHAVIALAKSKHRITQQLNLIEANREMIDFLASQVAIGESSRLDLTQAELTDERLKQDLRAAQADETRQALELQYLMGQAPVADLTVAYNLDLPDAPPEDDTSTAELLQHRPDYLLALAKLDHSDINRELELARRWEDVTIQLSGEQEDAVDEPGGLENNTLVGLRISLPLPLWSRNQEGIEMANLERQSVEQEIALLQFRIQSEYVRAVQARQDAYAVARASSGDFLILAEQNFKELVNAYEQGLANLFQVQLAQQQLIQLESAAVDARAAFHEAGAHLRHVKGVLLNDK